MSKPRINANNSDGTNPILFYPLRSAGQLPPLMVLSALGLALLLLAPFAIAIALYIPLVFINHWVNGTPLEFSLDRFEKNIEALQHSPRRVPRSNLKALLCFLWFFCFGLASFIVFPNNFIVGYLLYLSPIWTWLGVAWVKRTINSYLSPPYD